MSLPCNLAAHIANTLSVYVDTYIYIRMYTNRDIRVYMYIHTYTFVSPLQPGSTYRQHSFRTKFPEKRKACP